MSNDCPICGGTRYVVLPLRKRVTAVVVNLGETVPLSESTRRYPCPECGVALPPDRLKIMEAFAEVTFPSDVPQDEILRHLADRLAAHLAREGMVDMHQLPLDADDPRTRGGYDRVWRGKVGVMAPGAVATFEERVNARQHEIAAKVVEEAVRRIGIWGRDHNSLSIPKSVAADDVLAALKSVAQQRSAS